MSSVGLTRSLVIGLRISLAPYPVNVLRGDGSGRVSSDEEHTCSSQSHIFSLGHEHLRFFHLSRNRIYSFRRAKLFYKGKRIYVSQMLSVIHRVTSWSEVSLVKYCHIGSPRCPRRSTTWIITRLSPKRIYSQVTGSFQNRCSRKKQEWKEPGIGKNRFLLKLQKLSPLQWTSTGGVRRDEGGDSISGHVLCVRPSVATFAKLPMTLNAAGTCPKSHSQ